MGSIPARASWFFSSPILFAACAPFVSLALFVLSLCLYPVCSSICSCCSLYYIHPVLQRISSGCLLVLFFQRVLLGALFDPPHAFGCFVMLHPHPLIAAVASWGCLPLSCLQHVLLAALSPT